MYKFTLDELVRISITGIRGQIIARCEMETKEGLNADGGQMTVTSRQYLILSGTDGGIHKIWVDEHLLKTKWEDS